MPVSILVVDIADYCIFLIGEVTLDQSGWSTSENIEMLVFGKIVSYGPFETPVLQDQHHHQMTPIQKI